MVSHPVPDRFQMYQNNFNGGETLVRDYLNERHTSIKINKAILQSNSAYLSSHLKLPELTSSVERIPEP